MSSAIPVCLLLLLAPRLAAAPEFSVDSVLRDLAASYPQATRVSDALPAGVVATENVVYRQTDAGPLELDLYRPAAAGPWPAVLIVHGGGWIAGDRRMERAFARHLAARGFVAVPVSYRLGRAGRFPAPVHDLKAAVRWLRARAQDWDVDPARIAIVGASAGGTLAALVAATNGQPELDGPDTSPAAPSTAVQAAVVIDGTVTFMDNRLIQQSESEPSPYWEFLHGPYNANRAVWLAASPLNAVTRASAPTLFMNSTAKRPILAGREEMAERLRLLGVGAEIVVVPDTPHPFWLVHPWFERVVDETDRFLHRALGGAKRP